MFFPWVTAWLNLISLLSLFKWSLSRKAFPGHTLCDRPPGLLLLPLHRITVLGRTRAFYSYLFTCRLSDYSVSSTRLGTSLPSAVILMLRTSQAHLTPPEKKAAADNKKTRKARPAVSDCETGQAGWKKFRRGRHREQRRGDPMFPCFFLLPLPPLGLDVLQQSLSVIMGI